MGIPVHRNYNKYAWTGMARMEMASDLKRSGIIFQVSALVSQIKSLKTNSGLFFVSFEIHSWWSIHV